MATQAQKQQPLALVGAFLAGTLVLSGCAQPVAPAQTPQAAAAPAQTTTAATAAQGHRALISSAVHVPTPLKHEMAEMSAAPSVPAPITRKEAATVTVNLQTVERDGDLAGGVKYRFWTFGGTVPGPMVRVRQGDTVELRLRNSRESLFPHSIDLHAVTGPGGGAKATQTLPGGDTAIRFAALNPGLYVYHCATPNIPQHIANGMYGLILVEPADGLPAVDREFYVMQGDFYTQGATGEPGMQAFSSEKMLAEAPEYVVFNGKAGALLGDNAMKAKVGETVRIYFGVGGPNLTSSLHLIGEIFDRVYQEGNTSRAVENVQTTLVPAGGAAWVDFRVDVPGTYLLVNHSLARLHKGGVGALVVEGPEQPEVFAEVKAGVGGGGH